MLRTKSSNAAGFSLIELMVVVVIVSVLMAIALPAFKRQMMKGHRANAQSVMMEIANRQQQYLLSNRAYAATISDLSITLPPDVSQRYIPTMTVDNTGVPTYSISFAAKGSQLDDGGPLTLDHAGNAGPAGYWD